VTRPTYDWDAAYLWYAAQDASERNYVKVAAWLGCRKRTVEEAAIRLDWPGRVKALDAKAVAKAEAMIVRSKADRTADTLRIIDAARTRFAGQLARADFRLTGSDFVGLVKLEQLLTGEATDRVSLSEAQSFLQLVFAAALDWAGRDVPAPERTRGLKQSIDELVAGIATEGGETT
jgi:hypothetical protein